MGLGEAGLGLGLSCSGVRERTGEGPPAQEGPGGLRPQGLRPGEALTGGGGGGQRPRQAGAGALPEEELGEKGEQAEVQGTDPQRVQPGERGPGHTPGSPSATPGAAGSRVVLTRLLCGLWWPRDRPGTNPEPSPAGVEPGAGRGAGTLWQLQGHGDQEADEGLGPLTACPQHAAPHTQATPGRSSHGLFHPRPRRALADPLPLTAPRWPGGRGATSSSGSSPS